MNDLVNTEPGKPNAAGAHDGADAMGRAVEETRDAMRRAIDEARPKAEIVSVFIRASDISAEATGSEARYKKGKDLKRHAAFRETALRVDLLRAKWLTALEKTGRRFMGKPKKGQKAGTPRTRTSSFSPTCFLTFLKSRRGG